MTFLSNKLSQSYSVSKIICYVVNFCKIWKFQIHVNFLLQNPLQKIFYKKESNFERVSFFCLKDI